MMKNIGKNVLGMLVTMAFTSCASIVTGSKATVLLEGELPDTLTIQTNVTTYADVVLPQQVEVKRKRLKEPIQVLKDSMEVAQVYPGRKTNDYFWGNLAFVDVVGMGIDWATGSIYEPAHDVCVLNRTQSGIMVQYPPKVKKPANFYRHEIGGGMAVAAYENKSRFHEMEDVVERRLGYKSENQTMYMGAASVGLRYYYHMDEHWAVGLQLGRVGYYTHYAKNSADGKEQDANLLLHSPYLMATTKYYWKPTGVVSLYSKGGIGVQCRHLYFRAYKNQADNRFFDEKKWLPAFQFSPIAIEVGRRNFRFFTELGYGTEGFLSFGITYHFKRVR